MTQAGQDFLPRVPKQTNGPCARPSRFRKRLFCAFGPSQARLKNPRTWKRRKEGKKEGRGRERGQRPAGGGCPSSGGSCAEAPHVPASFTDSPGARAGGPGRAGVSRRPRARSRPRGLGGARGPQCPAPPSPAGSWRRRRRGARGAAPGAGARGGREEAAAEGRGPPWTTRRSLRTWTSGSNS